VKVETKSVSGGEAMNKKDDINKNTIIVGITSAAIIVIAIIAVIGIFTVKSHAQVKASAHQHFALLSLKNPAVKPHKDVFKLTKKQDQVKVEHVWGEVSKVQQHWANGVTKNGALEEVTDQYKENPAVAVSKTEGWHKVVAVKAAKNERELAVHKEVQKKELVA
jgi:hypothetical protein